MPEDQPSEPSTSGEPSPPVGPGKAGDVRQSLAYGEPDPRKVDRARLRLAAVLVSLFAAMLGYKVLHAGGLEQTALFYVGLPASIALLVALGSGPSRSATGTAMKAVTIGLALAGPLLNEGVICLVIAAPLFCLVAAGVGQLVNQSRTEDSRARKAHAMVLAPVLAVLCLEGTAGSLPRDNTVTVTRTVRATPEEFAATLSATPRFESPRPLFLRIPFPRPQNVTGTGLAVGDERVITFNPRRSLGIGALPTARSMRLDITESGPGRVLFAVTQDSATARWLDFRTSEVTWKRTSATTTEVTWTLGYRRTFDPAWYFGPLQRYGMEQAANHLADTFTPAARSGVRALEAPCPQAPDGLDSAGRRCEPVAGGLAPALTGPITAAR